MEYTVKKLAQLSGVSSRTLRYYDEIGLLKPKRITTSGYRIYGLKEVDCLQQILFLKQFGLSLDEIKTTLANPDFDITHLLQQQRQKLTQQLSQLIGVIAHLDQTLAYYQGGTTMKDQEKFAAFKAQKIQENETQYGKEIREKYGKEVIDSANAKWQQMTPADYQEMQAAENELFAALEILATSTAPLDFDSQLAQKAFNAHKTWLTLAAPFYNADYHRQLAEMYVADERFAAYYNDRTSQPSVEILQEIIFHYAKD